MIILVLGTPGSGKSDLAEDIMLSLKKKNMYYLATMEVLDEDGRERVIKHRKKRKGKGFTTLEITHDIAEYFRDKEYEEDSAVLLECVSNLVGNELDRKMENPELVPEKIINDILSVSRKVRDMVIVANSFTDSKEYDDKTRTYIRINNETNNKIQIITDKTHVISRSEETRNPN